MAAVKVVEDIEKPTTDKRNYRYVRLSNGLQVLLVSEEEAEMAAAALDLNVGSFFDPENAQGLAHFCEHMLFLGSESFPSENEYANYIKQHGGVHNACTEQTHTTFFFSVAAAHLDGALQRFAPFFICPLFTSSAAAREAQAVDSEFRLRKANDAVRRWHLLHHLSNPDHPFSQFSCGNLSSLTAAGDLEAGVREQLLRFYNTWYSSNIMTLIVLGRESLDELQRIIRSLFEKVENKGVPTMPSLTLLAKKREEAAARRKSAEEAKETGIQRTQQGGRDVKGGSEDAKRADEWGNRDADARVETKSDEHEERNGNEEETPAGTAMLQQRGPEPGENTDEKGEDKVGARGRKTTPSAPYQGGRQGEGHVTSLAETDGLPVFRPGIDLEKIVYVTPVKDFKEIHFQFVLPPLLEKWRTKPARFLGHLVGHEGKGSLLAALKKHALASGLNAWCLEEECVSIFHISIELTELGISDAGLNRVSELVLRYVQLLRAHPPAPWLYNEKQELAQLHFRFADKEDALSFCATHAKRLHLYPAQQTLSGAHIFFKYDSAEIQEVLQQLTLKNLRLEIVGKRFEEKCQQTEAIYGIAYGVYNFSPRQRELWTDILSAGPEAAVAAAAAEGLHYPAPNPFIPNDLSLRSPPAEASAVSAVRSCSSDGASATSSDASKLASRVGVAAACTSAGAAAERGEREACEASTATANVGTCGRGRAAAAAERKICAHGCTAKAAPTAKAEDTMRGSPFKGTSVAAGTDDVNKRTAADTTCRSAATESAGVDKQLVSPPPPAVSRSANTAALPVELRVNDLPALAGKTRFFFKQDDTFFLPKLSVRLWVSTSYSARGVKEWVLAWVYVDTVALMLNEELYDADIAGLFYSISGGDWPGEVSIALHGFNDKLPLMLHKLTYALAHRGHSQEAKEEEEEEEEKEDCKDGVADEEMNRRGAVETREPNTKRPEEFREIDIKQETRGRTGRERRMTQKSEEDDVAKDGMISSHPSADRDGLRESLARGTFRSEESERLEADGGQGHRKGAGGEVEARIDGVKGSVLEGDVRQKSESRKKKKKKKRLDRNMYELVKEGLLRRLRNRLTYRTVYQQAMTVCGEALEEPFYSYEEQIAAVEGIQYEEVDAVADCLFHRAHVEGLAVGNMHEEECLHMLAKTVKNLNIQETGNNLSPKAVLDLRAVDFRALSFEVKQGTDTVTEDPSQSGGMEDLASENRGRKATSGQQRGEGGEGGREEGKTEGQARGSEQGEKHAHGGTEAKKETGLPRGGKATSDVDKGEIFCVRVQQENPNPEDSNNAAFLRLQLGELELRDRAILALLSHWVEQPFFDEMRTQQQLGYVTQASKNVQLRTHTLDFFIASKYPPSLLAFRMERFLQTRLFCQLEQLQKELSEELFELHRQALVSELSVKPQNIYEETQRYVVEIYFKSFLFDRYAQTIRQLETLSRDECLAFIRTALTRAPALMLWINAQQGLQQQKDRQTAASRRLVASKGRDGTDAQKELQQARSEKDVAEAAGVGHDGNRKESKGGNEGAVLKEEVVDEKAEVLAEHVTGGEERGRQPLARGENEGEENAHVGVDEYESRGCERRDITVDKLLGKVWIDVSNPRRLRDFASRRFVVPP